MKQNTEKTRKRMVLLSVVVSLCIFSGIFGLILMNTYRQARERCYYIAQNAIEDIITTIDCVMARTYTLRALVEDHDGDTGFFDDFADNIFDAVKEETEVELKNIAVAPGGIVEKVYPLAGNESLVGFDFMDPSRNGNKEAIEAYEKGHTILTNPFELVQGGMGMAGRAPVILERPEGDILWGLITVTMDSEKLMDTLSLKNLNSIGYSYDLSYLDEDGKVTSMRTEGRLFSDPVESDFTLRNLNWRLSITPVDGWISTWIILAGIIIILIVSFLVGLLANAFCRIRESNERLKFLSYRDGLTGAYSRHYVNTVLVNMQDGTWTNPDMKYSLMIIDIDNFKHFNDNFGHDVGDRVIYAVAHALSDNIQEHCGDCVIRFGGDEFIVLFNDVTKERLRDKSKSIEQAIRSIYFEDVKDLKVTVSGGVATYEDCAEKTYGPMMQVADDKLYVAKEKGKDHIEL